MKLSLRHLKIDCFPDVDFTVTYEYETMDDHLYVETRTGYVFMIFYCLVMWHSKLHFETSLSTMKVGAVCFPSWMESVS